jgi:hypothetical protein
MLRVLVFLITDWPAEIAEKMFIKKRKTLRLIDRKETKK